MRLTTTHSRLITPRDPRWIRDPEIAFTAFRARMAKAQMADNSSFFHDTKPPWIITDPASVTLTTTDKALYGAQHIAALGGTPYFWAGKKVGLRVFGRATTVLTPGNFSWSLYFGSGADATGTILATSKVVAASASQTNLCWMAQLELDCRIIGSSGSILATGFVLADSALIANGYVPIAAGAGGTAPAGVTVDLTSVSNILSLQLKRSGSTVETAQVHQVSQSPLN
jgi:hypothetical protein